MHTGDGSIINQHLRKVKFQWDSSDEICALRGVRQQCCL